MRAMHPAWHHEIPLGRYSVKMSSPFPLNPVVFQSQARTTLQNAAAPATPHFSTPPTVPSQSTTKQPTPTTAPEVKAVKRPTASWNLLQQSQFGQNYASGHITGADPATTRVIGHFQSKYQTFAPEPPKFGTKIKEVKDKKAIKENKATENKPPQAEPPPKPGAR